jgi:pimeloyl-ACP methyl ester carboxylesterase
MDTPAFKSAGSSDSDSTSSKAKAQHFCLIIHGLWGNSKHLDYVASALQEQYGEDELLVYSAKRNAGSLTYDGIEIGAERVTRETEDVLEQLTRDGHSITKFSVVGYSLGGLVARYVVGLLWHKGVFDKIEPVNFTTFATPHLGVRTPLLGRMNHVWNVVGARLLSTSGRQMFTVDDFRDTGRPLLAIMADPESIFIHGLSKFKNKILYTNIANDRTRVRAGHSRSRAAGGARPRPRLANILRADAKQRKCFRPQGSDLPWLICSAADRFLHFPGQLGVADCAQSTANSAARERQRGSWLWRVQSAVSCPRYPRGLGRDL